MTQATSTTLGEIKLAGDLAGSNNALLPELTATGVVAGSYALPKITLDAKGRVLTAANSSSADILGLFPGATKISKGVVQIGDNINVSTTVGAARQTVFFNPGLTTGGTVGFCTNSVNYSATFVIDGVQYNYSVAGSALTTVQSLIDSISAFLPTPAYVSLDAGNLIVYGASGSGKTISIINDNLFRFMSGFTIIGTAVNGSGTSTISVYTGSTTQKGVVQAGLGLTAANGLISVNTAALAATTTTAGLVRAGSGISVNAGVISAAPVADATPSTKGLVQIGSNIAVSSGVISIPDASLNTKGIASVGFGLSVVDGLISIDQTIFATNSTPGLVKIGSGITSSLGVISVNAAASAGSVGLVKIGAGVTIDGSGVISTTAGGIVDATTSSKGIVQIGTGINVSAGLISVAVNDATSGTKGYVSVSTNNGLTINAGVVDVNVATSSVLGVVKSANTSNISITNGLVDVGSNIAKLDIVNTFTKAQVVALSTIASSASVTPDFSLSNTFYMDANQNFTLNAPTNVVAGGTYYIIIKQDATGGRLITWNGVYKFRGVAPTLSNGADKSDVIAIVARSSTILLTELQKGYA